MTCLTCGGYGRVLSRRTGTYRTCPACKGTGVKGEAGVNRKHTWAGRSKKKKRNG